MYKIRNQSICKRKEKKKITKFESIGRMQEILNTQISINHLKNKNKINLLFF